MTNASIAFTYMPFVLFTIATLIRALWQGKHTPVNRSFLVTGCMVLAWQLINCGFLLAKGERLRYLLYHMHLPFVAFAMVALLMFVVRFYRLERYITKGLFWIICIIPAITTAVCLTWERHNLLHQELSINADGPLYVIRYLPGAWFWIHTFYCYILLGITVFLVVYNYIRLPRGYRLYTGLLTIAILVPIFSNLINLLLMMNSPVDFSVMGIGISLLFMYMAMSNNGRLDFYLISRNEIFNYLDIAIFILDHEWRIVESNTAARLWLEECGIGREADTFHLVTRQLERMGATFKASMENQSVDVTMSTQEASKVYNLQEEQMLDQNGRLLGYFVTCSDVTYNRKLIQWLEQTAGLDALTGMPNRQKFHLVRSGYDLPGNLPIAVISGDVNGLKEVNDRFGHAQGDLLLKTVAGALEREKPERGFCFRIGGDEFLMLIPRCHQEEAHQVALRIEERLVKLEQELFTPSISLGVALKVKPGQDLDDVIDLADKNMYGVKRQRQSEPRSNQTDTATI